MPRSMQEIIDNQDELARVFEDYEPDPRRPAASLRSVGEAATGVARSQAELVAAIGGARADGHSWDAIGAMVGTSGEAARQRFGRLVADTQRP